jgi:hypothetical protein
MFIWARPPRFLLGPAHAHLSAGHGRGATRWSEPPALPSFSPLYRAVDRAIQM